MKTPKNGTAPASVPNPVTYRFAQAVTTQAGFDPILIGLILQVIEAATRIIMECNNPAPNPLPPAQLIRQEMDEQTDLCRRALRRAWWRKGGPLGQFPQFYEAFVKNLESSSDETLSAVCSESARGLP